MVNKKVKRIRRSRRCRTRIKRSDTPRLSVFRTPRHIYAQVLVEESTGSKVIASASTLDKALRESLKGNKIEIAGIIGKALAERAVKAGISNVAYDRSGFKYHGRVKALADAAREGGLIF